MKKLSMVINRWKESLDTMQSANDKAQMTQTIKDQVYTNYLHH